MSGSKQTSMFDEDMFLAILTQDQTIVKVNTIFESAVSLLKAAKIIYELPKVHPKYMLVHPKNRAGLGVSWHNVHRNGSVILAVGASLKQLGNAYCIEMSTDAERCKQQRSFNHDLSQRSAGLLAEVSGFERYLSLGCGHTAAFCRAAEAHCKTPQTKIADAEGRIDLQKIYKDPIYKMMCTEGWDWNIIPSWIDDKFPAFADIAQKALNASNHVASLVGEIEVSKSIADVMNDGGHDWENTALASINSMAAPSAPYANVMLKFVRDFSGGKHSPLLMFLDAVAKTFQCNALLGESYWTAVTEASFQTPSKNPLLRNALVLTNLTSPKFEDGIARLLTVKDISKLTTKAAAAKVACCEQVLSDAQSIVDALKIAGKLQEFDECKPLGKLWVRVVLLLTCKQSEGREGCEHTDVEIQKSFLKDISSIVGGQVKFAKWECTDEGEKPDSQDPSSVESAIAPISLAQHSDNAWVANQAGFEPNCFVYEKRIGFKPKGLYTIKELSAGVTTLELVCSYHEIVQKTVKIETSALVNEWGKYHGDPPYLFDTPEYRQPSLSDDLLKAQVFTALSAAASDASKFIHLSFFRKPDVVQSLESFTKGSLVLYPLVPISNLTCKTVASGFKLGSYSGRDVFAIPPQKPPPKKDFSEWSDTHSVFGFWWVYVDPTEDETLANMHIVSKRLGDFTVNVLVNSKAVIANARLRCYKPTSVKHALGNIISASADGAEAHSAAVAKAKATPKCGAPKGKAAAKAKTAANVGDKRKR
jgi:hypothetical protein